MKCVKLVLLIAVMAVTTGCQFDVQASATSKYIRKGENNNNEFLSRGSGMAGGNSYAAGGGNAVFSDDKNGAFFSWGKNKE